MCSVQMLHVDSNQKPLWFNAGLRKNKKSESKEYVNLTHYIPAGVRMEEQPKWRYMKRGLFCTDTKSERVKSMEGAGLTQLVENITVEARKVDEHFKTIEKGKSATNN